MSLDDHDRVHVLSIDIFRLINDSSNVFGFHLLLMLKWLRQMNWMRPRRWKIFIAGSGQSHLWLCRRTHLPAFIRFFTICSSSLTFLHQSYDDQNNTLWKMWSLRAVSRMQNSPFLDWFRWSPESVEIDDAMQSNRSFYALFWSIMLFDLILLGIVGRQKDVNNHRIRFRFYFKLIAMLECKNEKRQINFILSHLSIFGSETSGWKGEWMTIADVTKINIIFFRLKWTLFSSAKWIITILIYSSS